ncbi:FG-GAP-like repeat-containing protein, partial [Elusimicrobiota bacterium]
MRISRTRRLLASLILPALFLLEDITSARAAGPDPVTDLAVSAIVSTGLGASSMTVTLTWTVPDDDGGDLLNSTFSIHYSSWRQLDSDVVFDAASYTIDIPTDAYTSTLQTYSIDFLDASATHYFAIKSTDSSPTSETATLSVGATAQSYVFHPALTGGDSRGIAWGDYDGDGWLDLAVVRASNCNAHILHNEGDGTFTQVIRGAAADCYSVSWADYDNDGDPDLFTANVTGNKEAAFSWNQGDGTFVVGYLTGLMNTDGASAADYDSDGDLDLAAAQGSNVVLVTNIGNSTFTTSSIVGGGGTIQGLAWGDYDGDGDPDMAAATVSGSDIFLMQNDGDGTFTPVVLTGSGGDSQGVAWADYDNDGDLDLAVSNAGGEDAYILRNDGYPTYDKVVQGGSGGTSYGISWGDYDNDNDLDLAVGNDGSEDAYILRNDTSAANTAPTEPSGTFSASFEEHFIYATSGTLTLQWDSGVDSETGPELLNYFIRIGTTGVSGSSSTLQFPDAYSTDGMAGGGSSLYSTWLSSSPLQRGMKLILFPETTVHWAVMTEDAGFLRSSESIEQMTGLIAPAAITDLAAATVSTGLGASSMTVTLSWTAPGDDAGVNPISGGQYEIRYSTLTPMTSTDAFVGAPVEFRIVIATSVNPGEPQFYSIDCLDARTTHYFAVSVKDAVGVRAGLSNATTAESQVIILEYGGTTRGVAWGDYDGDGDLDFAAANNGDEFLATNNGDDTFTKTDLDAGGANTMVLAWGDYDNDGDLDLALGNVGSDEVLSNDGGGTFTVGATIPGTAGLTTTGIAWGDYDNDGDLDLAACDTVAEAYVAVNDSEGSFSTFTIAGMGTGNGIAWGDYDEDGDLDLAKSSDTDVAFARNDGNDSFFVYSVSGLGNTGQGVAWGDFQGNGDLDLAVAVAGAQNVIMRNDGGDTFVTIPIGATGTDSRGVAAGDYDNDGDLDLLVSNMSGQDELLLVNDGYPTFTEYVLEDTLEATVGASFGDMDGDGDLDGLVGNDSGGHQVLLRNDIAVANTAPGQPTSGLSSSFSPYSTFASSGVLILSWDDVTDDHTPADSIKYFVRVGTVVAGSSTTMKYPAVFGYGGYSGQSETPWSTRVSASQRGIKLVMQKETTAYWAVLAEDGAMLRGPESASQEADLSGPAAVPDLVSAPDYDVASSSLAWVKLTFTSPGEDGSSGNLQSGAVYDVRWSTSGPLDTELKYEEALHQQLLSAAGATADSGRSELVSVSPDGRSYYFAMTTKDQFGIRSGLSNATTGIIVTTLQEDTTQLAAAAAGQGDITAFLHTRLWTGKREVVWTGLRIRKEGLVPDEAIKRVAVYQDLNSNRIFEQGNPNWEDIATRSQPGVFISSAVTLTINNQLINNTTKAYFVGVEIDPDFLPVEGTTFSLRLDGEAFSIKGGGVHAGDFPAMDFDGTDDNVTRGFATGLNATSGVTLEAWIKTEDAGVDLSVITRGDTGGANGSGYRLWLNGDGGNCGAGVPTFYVGNDFLCANRAGAPVAVHDGRWHHVAGQASSEYGKVIFVDGVALSSGPWNPDMPDGSSGLGIGGPNDVPLGQYFTGQIDEPRISAFVRYSTQTSFTPVRRLSGSGAEVLYHFDTVDASLVVEDGGTKNYDAALEGGALGYGRSTFTAVTDAQDVLYSSGADITPSFMFRNQDPVPILRLQLWTIDDFVTLEELSVGHTGTGAEAGVDNIRMYLDDGDGMFNGASDTQLLLVSNFTVGKATFSLAANGKAQEIGPSTKTYFFAWKVGDSATLDAGLGLEIGATTAFLLSGGTDYMADVGFPIESSTPSVVAADVDVTAETPVSQWVNVSSIVFVGLFDADEQNNTFRYRYVWDNSPGTIVGTADSDWANNFRKSTMTATTDANDWYFHARAFDTGNDPGNQADFGPIFI